MTLIYLQSICYKLGDISNNGAGYNQPEVVIGGKFKTFFESDDNNDHYIK